MGVRSEENKYYDWNGGYCNDKQKVIFLDIDGVLKEEDYNAPFLDESFSKFRRVVKETRALLILFPSWQVSYERAMENDFEDCSEKVTQLYEMFEKYYIQIVGFTLCLDSSGYVSIPLSSRY